MGRVFGFHHGVAGEATEFHRLHDVHALVRGPRHDDDVYDRGAQEDQQPPPRVRSVEIEDRQQRRIFAARRLAQLAPPQHHAERNQDQPDDEQHRQDQVGQDAEVRPAFESPELHPEQRDHQDQCRQGDGRANKTDRVAR